MCGIIYVNAKNKQVALSKLWEQFEKQKSRGVEGFGFCSVDKAGCIVWERSQTLEEIKKKLKSAGSEIMFHHRYPTSTINVKEASHPIKVSNKELENDYYFIHNGVIRNDEELKEKFEDLGYKYTTEIHTKYITNGTEYDGEINFNDSESLAIDVVRYLEGKSKEIKASGSIAFMCYKVNKKSGKVLGLYYGKNAGNPLIGSDKGTLSSVGNEKYSIENDTIYYKDYETGKVLMEKVKVGQYDIPKLYHPYTNTFGFTDTSKNTTSYGKTYDKYHDWEKDYQDYIADVDYNDYDAIDELQEIDDYLAGQLSETERDYYTGERTELLKTLSAENRALYESTL
jgi:glucosamine 6-phosphate synthetase-like amidotransferase/phosphosugar isomerase protein